MATKHKRNTSSEIKVIHLEAYQPPMIVEQKNKDWVNYGEDNDYFSYLRGLYLHSATNNAIINSITELIYGVGLSSKDKSRKANEWAEVLSLVDTEDLPKVIADLKLNGNAAFQISKVNGEYKRMYHFPVETLRAEKANKKGEIEGFYYHPDWEKIKPSETPERFPAFGFGKKDEIEILYVKPYRSGFFYYAPVDYQGALPYAKAEQELAVYHVTNIDNSFSANVLINFNNGIPETDEEKRQIEKDVTSKFNGVHQAGKTIIAWNDDKERAATVEAIQIPDAHSQYAFLSNEARQQLMVGHRVTSPILLGIKDNTGFGNNAEELKTASKLFESQVVNGFRKLILSAIQKVLKQKNISIDLFFESLNPFKDEDVANADETQMCSHGHHLSDNRPFLDDDLAGILISNSNGLGEQESEILSDYELIAEDFSDDEDSDIDIEMILNQWARGQVKEESVLSKIKRIILGDANDDSYQDTDFFKVRYMYDKTTKDDVKGESRPLCRYLMSQKLIYRKEDIKSMSSKGGAEDRGEQYDVFLHKGGVNCQHGWLRKIYKKKAKKDGSSWGGGAMNSVSKAKIYDAIKAGAKVETAEAKKAQIAPRDTATRGHKK